MAAQRPPFSSWDDYFIPGTTTLRNLVGANDSTTLRILEEAATTVRISQLIFEVRAQVGKRHYRVLAFQDSPVHIIVLSCFYKDTRKTPKPEIDKAVERLKTWKANKN